MTQTIEIHGQRGGTIRIGGSARQPEIEIAGSGGVPVPTYDGPYEFTPSAEEQRAVIHGKKAAQDIVIHPIPQNYGLVTYNGSIITIT